MDFSVIKSLNLPIGEYVIYGSWPLDIHGIRPSRDIDILASKNLWIQLCNRYPNDIFENPKKIFIKEMAIEFFVNWVNINTPEEEIINNYELFNWLPFAKLQYVLEWKQNWNREKDKKDVELIMEYLAKNK
jgi:hypothetical protein